MQEIGFVQSVFYKKSSTSRVIRQSFVKGENFETHNTFLEKIQVDHKIIMFADKILFRFSTDFKYLILLTCVRQVVCHALG